LFFVCLPTKEYQAQSTKHQARSKKREADDPRNRLPQLNLSHLREKGASEAGEYMPSAARLQELLQSESCIEFRVQLALPEK
jgi:hypothetical protein